MSFVQSIPIEYIIFTILTLIVILFLVCVFTILHAVKLRKIMKNCPSGKLDETIVTYYNKIDELSNALDVKTKEFDHIKKMIDAGAQKVGLVRYDAFDDISSNLSFSLVLLDGMDTGFVLTSIYGRDTANAYIKPIIKGKSSYTLSEEELTALQNAIENYENKLK